MHKLVWVLLAVGALSYARTEECAFCNQAVLDYQKFYEDDLVVALYTHKPIFPGHCLIVPKRHSERLEGVTEAETAQIMRVIQTVNRAVQKAFGTSAYLLLQKNGKEVGQSVPHVHFHYVPRHTGEDSELWFVYRMFASYAQNPISKEEMQAATAKLRASLEDNDAKARDTSELH